MGKENPSRVWTCWTVDMLVEYCSRAEVAVNNTYSTHVDVQGAKYLCVYFLNLSLIVSF